MKYFFIVLSFFIMQVAKAQTITVEDVKVSVKADSPASAREQALDQAHKLAFEQLMEAHFPEISYSLPSLDELRDMVSDFSINREKTTHMSYSASLTFQFDSPLVQTWAQHAQQSSSPLPLPHMHYKENKSLKLTASYGSLLEWQHIRNSLENFPGVQGLSIFALSPKNASLEIIYGGPFEKLEQGLLQKGVLLSQREEGWAVSSKGQALH